MGEFFRETSAQVVGGLILMIIAGLWKVRGSLFRKSGKLLILDRASVATTLVFVPLSMVIFLLPAARSYAGVLFYASAAYAVGLVIYSVAVLAFDKSPAMWEDRLLFLMFIALCLYYVGSTLQKLYPHIR